MTASGDVLATRADILDGQQVWQSMGGQQIGTIWGHGAYQAPDWSADWLHREATALLDTWSRGAHGVAFDALGVETQEVLRARLTREMRTNTYDATSGTLTVSDQRAAAMAVSQAGRTKNPEAHDLYLRGLQAQNLASEPELRRALEFYHQALARDPDFALAYAAIAAVHIFLADAYVPPIEAYPKAKAAAQAAIERDSQMADAYAAKAFAMFSTDWDWSAAEGDFARALQLIPLTPGGVGPVELGLTGVLVGAGGPNVEVVAAVLIYRAFTVLPTLVLGLITIGAFRWLGPGKQGGGVHVEAGKRPTGEGAEPQGGDVEGAQG